MSKNRKKNLKWLFIKVNEIFPVHSVGILTARDRLTIKTDREEMLETVKQFITMEESLARVKFDLKEDTRDWKIKAAQKDILDHGIAPGKIVPILYRPFDIRYTYYTGKSRGFLCMPRPGVMSHMLKENLGLITVCKVPRHEFNHCFVTDTISESRVATGCRGISYLFPLYRYTKSRKKENIDKDFLNNLVIGFDGKIIPTGISILNYTYAVLLSNVYRKANKKQLRRDFPRIPFVLDKNFFLEIARIGEKLVNLHLMKSPELDEDLPGYIENTYDFLTIDKELWEYKLCGYQVLKKLLKKFTGPEMTPDEAKYVSRVVKALELTIKYQAEIDRLLRKFKLVSLWSHDSEEPGGWEAIEGKRVRR